MVPLFVRLFVGGYFRAIGEILGISSKIGIEVPSE